MTVQEKDFQYISSLMRDESAIVLEPGKEYLVESRLTPLAKEQGFDSIESMIAKIKTAGQSVLKLKIVEALTTNETSFFRDVQPFEMLRKELLPEIIEARKNEQAIRIWCAAASTGQEIYSICMTIREYFPELHNWRIEILGTDISHDVLDKAESAVYSQTEVNRGLPATMLIKYFEKVEARWKIKDEIKRMTEFKYLNLIKPWGYLGKPDIVFMRNVLIYFDTEMKQQILGNVRKVLSPDGYLFLGAAESTLNLDDGYERRAFERCACYRIKGSGQ